MSININPNESTGQTLLSNVVVEHNQKSTFTRQWIQFTISSIWQAIQSQNPPDWRARTLYSPGSQVTSNGYVFTARNGGESGRFPPAFLSGVHSFQDNTIEWVRSRNANESLDHTSNLYLSIGKSDEWTDETSPDDIVLDDKSKKQIKLDTINLFRIQRRNFVFGLKNTLWESGTVYDKYDGTEESQSEQSYVVIDGKFIFKCIDNNNGAPSTVKPTDTTPFGVITLADGYVWKFMASISDVDILNFSTSGYVPVRPQNAEGTLQWEVQQNAKAGELSSFKDITGSGNVVNPQVRFVYRSATNVTAASVETRFTAGVLSQIFVESPGAGYPDDVWAVVFSGDGDDVLESSNVTIIDGVIQSAILERNDYGSSARVFIIGDGTGATGTATISSNNITNIVITNGGEGYTWAKVIVVPGSNAWIAKAIMAPPGGHGKNIVEELPINTLLFSFRIIDRENAGYIIDPDQTEPVSFRQVALISAVQPVSGSSKNAPVYIGPQHIDYNNATNLNKYNPNTGYLLYVNNVRVINHYPDREELFKIAITF